MKKPLGCVVIYESSRTGERKRCAEFLFMRKKKARRFVQENRGENGTVLAVISIKSLSKFDDHKTKKMFSYLIRALLHSETADHSGPVAMIETLTARAFIEGEAHATMAANAPQHES